jgi:hypothetical protein
MKPRTQWKFYSLDNSSRGANYETTLFFDKNENVIQVGDIVEYLCTKDTQNYKSGETITAMVEYILVNMKMCNRRGKKGLEVLKAMGLRAHRGRVLYRKYRSDDVVNLTAQKEYDDLSKSVIQTTTILPLDVSNEILADSCKNDDVFLLGL